VDTLADDTTSGALPPLRLWPQSRVSDSTRDVDLQRPLEPLIDRRVSVQEPDIVTGDDYERQMELLQARLVQIQTELMALERSVSPIEEKLPSDQTPPAQNLSRREELLEVTARLLAATKAPTSDPEQDEKTPPPGGAAGASKTGSGAKSPLELYDPGHQKTQTRQTVSATARRQASARTTPQGQVGVGTGPSRTPTDVSGSQRAGQTARTPAQTVSGQADSASVRAFARHLDTAEHQFSCKQYTQAAKSFALASACLPNNARAHLGRSHALFAAGQYAGSVRSLAQAIELDLAYVVRPFDMIRIAGGPDAFVARFNELEKAVQTGKTPQLQLLLAYIYHQMQRPEEARIAVAAAQQALPSSIPVDLLKTAIDK
jgi:tetratricopeptide (TPR) repeat protein